MECFDIAIELEEDISPISADVSSLNEKIEYFELEQIFNGDDANNCIVSINSGSGGLEAQDWARMLFRMYQRWCEKHGFEIKILNILKNGKEGLKNIDFLVSGKYAYGYLKVETGVHRLVRNSPFDAKNSRHTSFSAVFVSPEIDDKIVVEVRENDLRIDYFCASGPGGQNVNKVESAVRITHLPSKIVVSCQNERSKHQNLEMAHKLIRSKLYELERMKQMEKMSERHDNMSDISWGYQIRSYFLQPKVIIKDHRTQIELYNADAVLGGDIDVFIKSALIGKK